MTTKITNRFNIRSVKNMVEQLETWIETSQETLDNEYQQDYPNDDRIEMLEDRISNLQTALEALQDIE